MKKYKVITNAVVEYEYIVKANSKEEAEEKFWDNNYEECEETPSQNVNAEEEVINIELITTNCVGSRK